MSKTRLFYVLFMCFVAVMHIFAQTPKPAKSSAATPTPGKKCEAQMARLLIDQLTTDSKSIEETDKRVNVLIKVADFLWVPDVESARPLFAEAFQIARDRYKEKGFESSTGEGGLITQTPDYRFHVIQAIAKRDSKWARQLTEIVLKDKEEEAAEAKRKPYDKEREVSEIIQLGLALLETDEASGLMFLRRAMQFPFMQNWIYVLYQVAAKNVPLADRLYVELLNAYGAAAPSNLLYLSIYPFAASQMIGLGKSNLTTSVPAGFSPNRDLQRQFLTIFLRRLINLDAETGNKRSQFGNATESAYAYAALREIEPLIMRQFTELAEFFLEARTNVAGLITDVSTAAVIDGEKRNRDSLISFEEKIRNLERADDEGKLTDYMIAKLIMESKKDDNFEMLESWLDKIQEEEARINTFQYFYFTRSKLAVKEKRFEDARKYADKVATIQNRAILYFDIADAKIKDPVSRFDALDTLNEVYKMAQRSADTVEKAQIFMGLAFAYEGVDHFNALDALSNAIKTAGNLNSPDLFTGSKMQQIKGKDFSIFTSYSVPGFDISRTFYELSKGDFQGTLTQAEGFTDKYLRTLAILAVVKDCEKNMRPAAKPKVK